MKKQINKLIKRNMMKHIHIYVFWGKCAGPGLNSINYHSTYPQRPRCPPVS